MKRIDPYLLLLIAFSLFAIGPLLGPGYFWGAHDGRHSVYFLFEFDRAIQDGIWYPRWAPDFAFGYGYPMFNIYAPGALYVSEFLHLAGLDFVTATKTVFVLALVLSGPAMFGFIKHLTGSSQAAFLSGLAYIYIPYHIADIYVRGALEESVALVLLPLTLWGFYETVRRPRPLVIAATAVVYGALAFTHTPTTLLFTLVLAAWVLFLMAGELRASQLGLATRAGLARLVRLGLPPLATVFLGAGLAAVFLIPAVVEYKYVRTDQWLGTYYDYTQHFVYPFQFFSPQWGFGISLPGPNDGMSFQLGAVPVLLAILSSFAIVKNPNNTRRFWIFFLGMTGVVAVLMLGVSLSLWRALPFLAFDQFPWRLLSILDVSLAAVAGAVVLANGADGDSRALALPTLLLGTLIIAGSFPYLTAQTLLEAKEGPVSMIGLMKFEHSAGEMTGSTAWVQTIPTWSNMADVYLANKRVKTKIDLTAEPQPEWVGVDQTGKGLRSDGERVRVDSAVDDQPVTFNTFYYPGWRAYLTLENSDTVIRELKIEPVGELGRMQVHLPKGRFWLILRFEDTLPRVIGQWVSACSVLVILGLAGWQIYSERRSS